MSDLEMSLLDYYFPIDEAVVTEGLFHIFLGDNMEFSLNGEAFRSILGRALLETKIWDMGLK